MRNVQRERPIDIARHRKNTHLLASLTPSFKYHVDPDDLHRMQCCLQHGWRRERTLGFYLLREVVRILSTELTAKGGQECQYR